jgi:autotransporter-associated beta strand protein
MNALETAQRSRSSILNSSAVLSVAALLVLMNAWPLSRVEAVTFTWSGDASVNQLWSNGANWVGGVAPASAVTTDLIFAGTTNTGTMGTPLNQNIATPFVLNSITFSAAGGTFFLGGASLRFDGASNTITQSSSSPESIANTIDPTGKSGNNTSTITLTGAGTGVVTLSGNILIGNGLRDYAISKTGTSTFVLSGTNTYGGGTAVTGGTLLVNNTTGSGTGAGAVTVSNSGTTLGGTGTISGAVTINSGASILGGTGAAASGTLTLANNLTLNSGSIIELALGPAGAHSTLARTGGTWSFQSNQAFTFINLGATVGTYNNIITGLASNPGTGGWTITNPGFVGTFTFDGANIDLTLTAVPEPSTWIAGALALAALAYAQRRRLVRARNRLLLRILALAFAVAIWLPRQVNAEELKEARVTQIIQDVKLLPSNAAPRPAAINDDVRHGTAVKTGVQSRSELTFKDKTITRLGEKTIFSVGEGARTIELSSGQFLLYVPKGSGGAKVKMGAVTAAITGTTVLGNVNPNGTTTFTVLEGSACIRLDSVGQALMVHAGQKLTFDPIANRLEDPVDVDLDQVLTSPLIREFRRLPSAPLIEQEVERQHGAPGGAKGNAELTRAVKVAGASSVDTATPDQFMRALNSLLVRSGARQICDYVGAAVAARPDMADRIVVAALSVHHRWSCDEVDCIIREAIAAHPAATAEIVRAATAAAPMLRDCIVAAANLALPCQDANAFVEPVILNTINAANTVPGETVSPEQPPPGQ